MRTERNGKTILVADDDPEVSTYLEMALRCQGYGVEIAQNGQEALQYLYGGNVPSAILLDIMMPIKDGMETLREIRRMNANIPVVMISGDTSTLNVVEAMKCGATHFLNKPVNHEELRTAISTSIDPADIVDPSPQASVPTGQRAAAFFGTNPKMQELQALVGRVGWSEEPVLIQGETGSGKEVLARQLHALSPRAKRPFLKLNCAALPSELVESELFGYERGAFTGAMQRKPGMFELADSGTLLLDEIGDMDVKLQAKLLQVLQDREFQRLGGKETIRVDVRILAATHRNLDKAIDDGEFRSDLYYRLNVINLCVPALRELPEDVVALAEFLLRKHQRPGATVTAMPLAFRQALVAYDWPGNVRELDNLVRRVAVLGDFALAAEELSAKASGRRAKIAAQPSQAELQAPSMPILEQVTHARNNAETEAILAALKISSWNRKQAAILLKIDYKALLYKMKKLAIEDKPLLRVPMDPDTDALASIV